MRRARHGFFAGIYSYERWHRSLDRFPVPSYSPSPACPRLPGIVCALPLKFQKHMENTILRISKALLDVASASDVVLYATPKGSAALKGKKLENVERILLERIDGFRSIEQVLAMSGDLIGVHGALGKLMAAGYVTSATHHAVEAAVPVEAAPVAVPAEAHVAAKVEVDELDNAKRVLIAEVQHALGAGAAKLRPRIEACRSIEDIYDLIVKVQEHLKTTGKADPDVFLDRLTAALAAARKPLPAGKRPSSK